MKAEAVFSRVVLCFIFSICSCARQNDFQILKGPYLGQSPPGMEPKIFAPGFISTEQEEFGCAFNADGTEFYFTRAIAVPQKEQKRMTIMVSRLYNNEWQKPERAPFCKAEYAYGEPNFSSDGDLLLYGRLKTLKDGSQDPRVMIAEWEGNHWGTSIDLMHGMFASITKDNIIYYTDVTQGYSKGDIFKVQYHNGHLHNPVKLGGKINSPQQDAHPFVTPAGDLLIFDSNRPGGYGNNDLYICFLKDDGSWSDPINMGAEVNTKTYDAIPYLTYDAKYLFFFRDGDIYWINASFIENLKQQ